MAIIYGRGIAGGGGNAPSSPPASLSGMIIGRAIGKWKLSPLPLSSCSPGRIVTINENDTPTKFLVLCHDYPVQGRTLLLRNSLYNRQQWNASGVNTYDGSSIDTWLTNSYYNMIDSNVRSKIAAVDIECAIGNGNWTVSTLSRPVFLLSSTECGFTYSYVIEEGAGIPYFDSDAKRIAYLDDSANSWWLRTSGNSGTNVATYVSDSGRWQTNNCAFSFGIRPAFTLPSSIIVGTDGKITG